MCQFKIPEIKSRRYRASHECVTCRVCGFRCKPGAGRHCILECFTCLRSVAQPNASIAFVLFKDVDDQRAAAGIIMPGLVAFDAMECGEISRAQQEIDGGGHGPFSPESRGQRGTGNVLGSPVSFTKKTTFRMRLQCQTSHEGLNISGIVHVNFFEKLFFVHIEKIYSFMAFQGRPFVHDRYRLPDV